MINATPEQVVAEALSWKGTPYMLKQCVKGAGCDCATFILGVVQKFGVMVPDDEIGFYWHDFYATEKDDRYLLGMMKIARKLHETKCWSAVDARPGCVVLAKLMGSRFYNHAGLVVEWPMILHCVQPEVMLVNASLHPMWMGKEIVVMDFWGER